MNKNEACKILGIDINCNLSLDIIKKAYIKSCKLYHPDNVGSDLYLSEDNNCQEAYLFLINLFDPNSGLTNNMNYYSAYQTTVNPVTFNSFTSSDASIYQTKNKIIGSKPSQSFDHNAYIKKQQEYKKNREEKRVQTLSEVLEKSKELNKKPEKKFGVFENVEYKEANDILDQIRWLRLSKIIHDTIEADKLKAKENESN